MTSIQIDRTDGLSSATAIKGPCRVATTANISLIGLQTIDGVALAVGDRVLVKDQTAANENGIYVTDTGPWRRAKDFSNNRDLRKGTRVWVTDGAVRAETDFLVTNENPIVIGTTELAFVAASASIGDGDVGALQISDDSDEQAAMAFKLGLQTNGDYTVYVGDWSGTPGGGVASDTTGDGSLGAPYATPQKAWDSLPWLIKDKVVIRIADGTYGTSSRSAASMDRPALIYLDGKKIGRRTDGPGGVMTGGVAFIGESQAGVIFQPGSASGYTRAVYVTGHIGSVALQNFTIDALTGAEAGIVAHRGSYVHVSDVEVDGNSIMTFGLVGEATGYLEGIDIEVHHCALGVQCYQASVVQLSQSSNIHDCSSQGINLANGGYVGLTTGSVCSSSILQQAGGQLDFTGITSSRVLVSGAYQNRGGDTTMAFADLSGNVTTYPGAKVNAGATGWSKQWTDYGGELYLPGCKSYIAPATQSDVAFPLLFLGGEKSLYVDANFEIKNSSGVVVSEGIGTDTVSITANGQVITGSVIRGKVNTVFLTAAAGRTGVEFPSGMGGRFAGTPVPPGTILYALSGSSSTIEIVNGSTGDIPGGAITIAAGSGSNAGVVGVMGPAGKWIIAAHGAVR